jgi:hypothetical protein
MRMRVLVEVSDELWTNDRQQPMKSCGDASVAAHFGVTLSDRVNNRGQQEHTDKPMQQADRMAGPIHFVGNEFGPF